SFEKKGMLDLAIKELEKARAGSSAMDETAKEITYRLATILEKAGHKAKAAAEYEKIIEVDIGYKDAMKRMEALKAAANNARTRRRSRATFFPLNNNKIRKDC